MATCKTVDCVGELTSYSEFCRFCYLKQENEKMLWRIKQIEDPSVSDEQISSMFETAEFKSTLVIYTIQDHLNAILLATYRRSHALLQKLVSILQQKAQSNIFLTVCIHNHCEPKFCKMFTDMHENKMLEYGQHSTKCLTCFIEEITRADGFIAKIKTRVAYLANLKNYLYNFALYRNNYTDTLISVYETIMAVVDCSKFSLEHGEMCWVIEKMKEHITNTETYSSEEIAEVFEKIYEHPLMMSQNTKFIKKRMREHTAAWKTEWLAKALHPSRAWAWCYDTEEQEELKGAGMVW